MNVKKTKRKSKIRKKDKRKQKKKRVRISRKVKRRKGNKEIENREREERWKESVLETGRENSKQHLVPCTQHQAIGKESLKTSSA